MVFCGGFQTGRREVGFGERKAGHTMIRTGACQCSSNKRELKEAVKAMDFSLGQVSPAGIEKLFSFIFIYT